MSALGSIEGHESVTADVLQATGTEGASLRQIVAERVAAHRSRHAQSHTAGSAQPQPADTARLQRDSRYGAARVRDAVRARYEHSQSYREFLAAEAERALQQAQAEAEVAARTAQAVAAAQMQLLEELEQWKRPEPGPREQAIAEQTAERRGELAHALADIVMGAKELIAEPQHLTVVEDAPRPITADLFPVAEEAGPAAVEATSAGYTVRLYEGFAPSPLAAAAPPPHRTPVDYDSAAELETLEQEIEFRRAPELTEHTLETLPLPANLIEFPRQLIAPRRARPRLAEGPLREELAPEPQLRIFEVEPEQISTEPDMIESAAVFAPDWQGLMLDSAPHAEAAPTELDQAPSLLPPQTAPLSLRVMAATVDACCVAAAFLVFVTAVALLSSEGLSRLSLPLIGVSAGFTLGMMAVLYQVLFFSLNEATPGMRYARIGLCTFGDENPSRQAMRRRVMATALAICPLGLGILWMWMDDDGLGWHDRISRMYPRAY